MNHVPDPPNERSAGDVGHAFTKALAASVPVAGGALSVLLDNVLTAPIEKRKQAWLQDLAGTINELVDTVEEITSERLSNDEAFITAALQATQIALRNHQEEKLEALRNAIINSALRNEPDEDLQLQFIRLIDRLTPWHLRLLALLDNPREYMQANEIVNPGWGMGGPIAVIEHCFPELRTRTEFCQQLVRELQVEGLIGQGQFLNVTMTGDGMMQNRTVEAGRRFLAFITNP